jgi:myo-inositol catabolism protein IolS
MEELERMRREGKIRAIGVSNFTPPEMDEARRHGRIDVLQPPYNLFWRFVEGAELPYCLANDIGVMTYSSLAQGLLTGALNRETEFAAGDARPTTVLFQHENYARCLDAVDALRLVAAAHGVSLAQLAIRWVTEQPGISASLLGARTIGEIEENAGGVGWDLSAEALEQVGQIGWGVFEQLPHVPDMFQNCKRWDLQRRRYERMGFTG